MGETALLIALKKKDLAVAKTMLDAGTDPNIAAVNGVTPLMAAAHAGLPEMVAALLAKGADPAAVDRIGKNAMVYAAGEGHEEIVRQLIAHGVDPNAVYRNDLTALMWAAGYGRSAAVAALLAAGARARTCATIAARPRSTSRTKAASRQPPRSCRPPASTRDARAAPGRSRLTAHIGNVLPGARRRRASPFSHITFSPD